MQKEIKSWLSRFIAGSRLLYSAYDEGVYLPASNISLFKNKHIGKRVFILGNGPSLNKHDLSLLKDEYSFAVNGIFYKTDLMGYRPTFYVVEDKHVMADNKDRINEYDVAYKFFPRDYRKYTKNKKNTFFFTMDKGYYNKISPYFCVPRFSCDADHKLFCGQSVTMINLQLAYYFGFSEVYLIGMDHSYVIPPSATVSGEEILSNEDDPNHFHPEYFGRGKTWHDPHLDRVERTYEYFKLVYEAKDRKIFNATEGGNLEVFQRVNYTDLFDAKGS